MSTAAPTQQVNATQDHPPAPLGQPDHIAYVVPDVDVTSQQLARAAGSTFAVSEKTVTVRDVTEAGTQPRHVTLRQAVSIRDNAPTTELVQATPAVGPWRLDDRARMFLSYEVDRVSDHAATLQQAGMRLVAEGDGLAFWQGTGGVTVRLVEDPPAGGPSTPTPVDLGAPVAVALFAYDLPAVADQLTRALGVTWREPQDYALDWRPSEGTRRALTTTSMISESGGPYLVLETPHDFPSEEDCSAEYSLPYLVYAVTDVAGADAQLHAAGLRFVARVPAVLAAYRATGVPVEVASQALVPE